RPLDQDRRVVSRSRHGQDARALGGRADPHDGQQAGMSPLRPLHTPTMKPDHPEGQARGAACFAAPSRFGPLMLELASGARRAAEAATALHGCEPLVMALHAWPGVAHEWRWTDRSRLRLVADSYALARWQIADRLHGLVELPWALMRSLPTPATEIAQ